MPDKGRMYAVLCVTTQWHLHNTLATKFIYLYECMCLCVRVRDQGFRIFIVRAFTKRNKNVSFLSNKCDKYVQVEKFV